MLSVHLRTKWFWVRVQLQSVRLFLLVIVYCVPGPLGSFIDDFILLINELLTQLRVLIVGDSSLDQM